MSKWTIFDKKKKKGIRVPSAKANLGFSGCPTEFAFEFPGAVKGVGGKPPKGDAGLQERPGFFETSGKFVVYRTDPNGRTHGYETTWKGLRNDQRAALQKAGAVTKHGRIKEPE